MIEAWVHAGGCKQSSPRYPKGQSKTCYQECGCHLRLQKIKHNVWADLRKGPTLRWGQTFALIAHTCYKFRAPPTSSLGVGIASVKHGKKSAILGLTLEPHHFR